MTNKAFEVKVEENKYTVRKIKTGVPQVSVLEPMLYNIYTYISKIEEATIALYADDLAVMASSRRPQFAKALTLALLKMDEK